MRLANVSEIIDSTRTAEIRTAAEGSRSSACEELREVECMESTVWGGIG